MRVTNFHGYLLEQIVSGPSVEYPNNLMGRCMCPLSYSHKIHSPTGTYTQSGKCGRKIGGTNYIHCRNHHARGYEHSSTDILSFRRARRSRFGWELLFGAGLESVDFFPDQKKRHLQRLELHTCETIVVGEVKQPMDSGSRHNLYTRLKRIEEYL